MSKIETTPKSERKKHLLKSKSKSQAWILNPSPIMWTKSTKERARNLEELQA
jgi:hypothetical protein